MVCGAQCIFATSEDTEDALRSDTAPMGYNPYRKHRSTRLDYVLLAAAAIVAAGLVVWALVG